MHKHKNGRNRRKRIPAFSTEAQEREFWKTHDTVDYVDWSQGRWAAFPNLKPSTETISLRLPAMLLANLKILANKRDVPYQSLLKIFLAERMAQEQVTERSVAAGPKKPAPRRHTPGHNMGRSSGAAGTVSGA